jgi:acetoin utilization protein AcuB
MKVRQILDAQPVTASPQESAGAAWERMRERGADHIVVLVDGRVVGMLSRQDLEGPAGGTRRRMGRRVGDLMRGAVVTATPETGVRRAATLMRRHGIGALPVVAGDRLVGIVTVSHLLALLEKELAP